MGHILIVDDEKDILEILKFNIEKEGYTVDLASNGLEALEKMKVRTPDLVLLDVMMPMMDGIETCQAIKENAHYKDVIICFLTARAEDYSQIAGLEAGGDDYISKPIKPKVLMSRIHALLRRKNRSIVVQLDTQTEGIIISRETHLVYVDGVGIQLPRKEFELLSLLASKPNNVFKRESILANVWGNNVIVGDRTIDVHIRKLREKIGEKYIATIKGVGYKFVEN
ncbi:MAG: DNA-binding response regulator [Flavobacteriia bacterium]|nr:DNA-binding response regulator [Flavobacteriia bacterium]